MSVDCKRGEVVGVGYGDILHLSIVDRVSSQAIHVDERVFRLSDGYERGSTKTEAFPDHSCRVIRLDIEKLAELRLREAIDAAAHKCHAALAQIRYDAGGLRKCAAIMEILRGEA